MASLIARASVGSTVIRALFHSVWLPLLTFGWGLPRVAPESWQWLGASFKLPNIQILSVTGLLLFIWVVWGRDRTVGDVAKGAMLPIRRLSKQSLDRWMAIVTLWLACYIPGWFMLGWLPLQVMVTLGGLFIMIVAAIFIGAWGAFVFPLSVAKKYKPLGSP